MKSGSSPHSIPLPGSECVSFCQDAVKDSTFGTMGGGSFGKGTPGGRTDGVDVISGHGEHVVRTVVFWKKTVVEHVVKIMIFMENPPPLSTTSPLKEFFPCPDRHDVGWDIMGMSLR